MKVMIPYPEIILRLCLGALLGGILGFEREAHGRAAGFRTQLIVCLASVLIMIVSENYYYYLHNQDASLRIDPARISAGALIGIGFLGAGVIVKSGYAVRGLTTAASIWIISAIGLAIGGGLYVEGLVTFTITIIALMFLRKLEKRIKTLRYKDLIVSASDGEDMEEMIALIIADTGFHIHAVDYETKPSTDEIIYRFSISSRDRDAKRRLFRKLLETDSVNTIRISG